LEKNLRYIYNQSVSNFNEKRYFSRLAQFKAIWKNRFNELDTILANLKNKTDENKSTISLHCQQRK
jgi:hypothetical protein